MPQILILDNSRENFNHFVSQKKFRNDVILMTQKLRQVYL